MRIYIYLDFVKFFYSANIVAHSLRFFSSLGTFSTSFIQYLIRTRAQCSLPNACFLVKLIYAILKKRVTIAKVFQIFIEGRAFVYRQSNRNTIMLREKRERISSG